MTRALYHAFKLYIKIHGETFCCLTFLGGKNFEQHFPDLGDWKSPYRESILASHSNTYKRYIAVSLQKSCTLTTLPLLQSLKTGTYSIIQIILFITMQTRANKGNATRGVYPCLNI
jgi:hypothetical protein